ncbi:MAG: hypothetical protein K6B46_00310 [Opitutales bacterium]|nr:hypothetical protein [Opitutales bacterium]
MATFVYVVINPDGSQGETLEIEQSINDAPLTRHPLTGEALQRVHTPAGLVLRYGEGEIKRKVNDERELAKLGFTRYERDPATGRYHKTAGNDPAAPESFVKPAGNELLPHEDHLIHGPDCNCSHCRGNGHEH